MNRLLNLNAISGAVVQQSPYPYLLNSHFIKSEHIDTLRGEFPAIHKTGFHPASEMELKDTFKTLIDELEGRELTDALSERFKKDFSPFPRLVTIRKMSAIHEGRIHCDSKSKIMSLLLYMNDDWMDANGKLRVLYNETNMDSFAVEVPPTMGSVFAFLRQDNSWHGHAPFIGERRVIQVAWLASQQDIERKKKRSFFTSLFKKSASSEY